MPSRRDVIRMSDQEVHDFLSEGRKTLQVASFNHDETIHLVAMWFALDDGGAPVFWTYRRSQKILNLERDPRITCLVETGDTYETLRGVELVGTAEVIRERDKVMDLGLLVADRYFGPITEEARPFVEKTGEKRYGVRVKVDRVVSWDHSKLGGAY